VPRAHFVLLIGLWALVGNLLLGWLADRWGRRWVFGLSLTLGALALGGMTAGSRTRGLRIIFRDLSQAVCVV
jgi:MFS family permease